MNPLDKNGRAIAAGAKVKESLASIYRNREYKNIDVSWEVKSQGGELNVEIKITQDNACSKEALNKVRNSIGSHAAKNKVNCQAYITYCGEDSLLTIRVSEKASYLRFRRGKFLSNFQRVQKLVDKFIDLFEEYASCIDKSKAEKPIKSGNEQPSEPSTDWQVRVRGNDLPNGMWTNYPSDGGLKL